MADVETIVLAVAALLVVVGFVQPLAARLRLPTMVLLAAIGTGIGATAGILMRHLSGATLDGVMVPFANPPVTADGFLFVFLPVLLFEASLNIRVRRLIEDAVPVLVLAIAAVLVTTGAIGVALHWMSGVPLIVCLLLGSIVATTDPSAVVAIFRDLGAPARLTRLVEGESLLNDATAIAIFTVLSGMIRSGGPPHLLEGTLFFVVSFIGGLVLGILAGRLLMWVLPLLREDRAAEMTLALALPYLVFVLGERVLDVSGVVAVVASGLTVGSMGRARISPFSWAFHGELWSQLAFWAGSLVFVLAALTMPRLLAAADPIDALWLAGMAVAALAARFAVIFGILPPLAALRLSPPVATPYMLALAWGGLRGAVTVALALAVSEENAFGEDVKQFVGVLATGFVLVTLFVNGTTLRPLIHLLKLDRLSARDEALRTQVLALSLARVRDAVLQTARDYRLRPSAAEATLQSYDRRLEKARARQEDGEALLERDRLAIGLVALASHERRLVLEHYGGRTVSREVVEMRLRDCERMIDAARTGGRVGYQRAARKPTSFSPAFRFAHFLHRRFGVEGPLARRLSGRFESLLLTRLLLEELTRFAHERLAPLVGERMAEVIDEVLRSRRENVRRGLDAVQLQYPEYAEALERRFVKQSALRQEQLEYASLHDEGLIGRELYDDLSGAIKAERQAVDRRPQLDLKLDAQQLMGSIDLFAELEPDDAERLARLFRPAIALPGQVIFRKGQRGDSVFFISSGAVEVRLDSGPIVLGRGAIVGEMALILRQPRQADVVAVTYCQLLVLTEAAFRKFLAANEPVRRRIERITAERQRMNEAAAAP